MFRNLAQKPAKVYAKCVFHFENGRRNFCLALRFPRTQKMRNIDCLRIKHNFRASRWVLTGTSSSVHTEVKGSVYLVHAERRIIPTAECTPLLADALKTVASPVSLNRAPSGTVSHKASPCPQCFVRCQISAVLHRKRKHNPARLLHPLVPSGGLID